MARATAAQLPSAAAPVPSRRRPRNPVPPPFPSLPRPPHHTLSASTPSPTRLPVSRQVSTVPVEQAPVPEFDVSGEISHLLSLRSRLQVAGPNVAARLRVLDSDPRVREFFSTWCRRGVLQKLSPRDVMMLKSLVAAGQGHVLGWEMDAYRDMDDESGEGNALKKAFYVLAGMVEQWGLEGGIPRGEDVEKKKEEETAFRGLLKTLDEVEHFYDCVGGIIGYQIIVLELLTSSREKYLFPHHLNDSVKNHYLQLHIPSGLDLSQDVESASQAALWGIEGLPKMGEIYPLGGAGDRLGLVDSETGECLPAAMLPYCGRTLLEGLIRDLQAREFLYFKVYRSQCITPIAIMTSLAKNNHTHIRMLCERLKWFGRGKTNFKLFEQPLVPVVSAEDGQWLITEVLVPVCKPGGHGAIWKLAHDKGIFKWFSSNGRRGATVRQVSNIAAATDVTLLALAGIGLHQEKKLGFASCQRNPGATEGINVLIEKRNLQGEWEYGITCIEYTEFDKFGIKEASGFPGRLRSDFPANTNILYVDLPSAEKVGSCKNTTCLPGIVLNLKKPVLYRDHFGFQHSASGGRLECTMQNIADSFMNTYSSRFGPAIEAALDTYVVYNNRRKVTSSAKRKRKPKDKRLQQTPDGALLDIFRNARDLLSDCNIKIPQIEDNDKYLHSVPPYIILLHPALGPIWEVTRQKFFGGSISEGSELQLEVAEFLWQNVELDGSLLIVAENVMGSVRSYEEGDPILEYGYRCGRCKLQNVKVMNKGIDWNAADNVYWKHDVQRHESLQVSLHGNAEFVATDVVLQGNHVFNVPNGCKMSIAADDSQSGFLVKVEAIKEEHTNSGSWFWRYKIEDTHVRLEMVGM